MKQKIKNAGLPVVEYHADWNKDQKRLVALGKFGEQVALNLFESLKGDPELASRFTSDATTFSPMSSPKRRIKWSRSSRSAPTVSSLAAANR